MIDEVDKKKAKADVEQARRQSGFGKRLVEIRHRRGLTQQQLCKQIGVHITQLSNYENDHSQPTLQIIRRMALVLDVMADELVFDHDERKRLTNVEVLVRQIEGFSDDNKSTVKSVIEAINLKQIADQASR